MFGQTFMRWTFYICVPLFLIATGYLQSKKEFSFNYYKGIIPILFVYVLYSVISIIVRVYAFGEEMSLIGWGYKILIFDADGYSWYVNMFIGLFLLIPFINLIFNNLNDKKQHCILIAILFLLCGLPSFFNNLPITLHNEKFISFPNWWNNIWPLLYYFIGSFIKKYQPSINKLYLFLVFVLVVLFETILTFHFSNGGIFSKVFNDYQSAPVVISSVLFFLLFYRVNISNNTINKGLQLVSSVTLDIYLASYFIDLFIYRFVMNNVFDSTYQIIYYFVPIVGTVFILATTVSIIRKSLTDLFRATWEKSIKSIGSDIT